MTDRAQAFIVVLDDDYRLGDFVNSDNVTFPIGAEAIAMILRQIKGVASVEPIMANTEDHMARQRIKSELRKALVDALDDFFKGN